MSENVKKFPTATMSVQMGPSHPSMHGIVKLNLELDGETILRVEPEIGYLHRGFEKMCEVRTWNQVLPFTDRLNYVSAGLNNVGYHLAVEKLIGLEIPERAKYIRVIFSELFRIIDHFICVAAAAMELGGFTVYFYCVEAREKLFELTEGLSGARITTSYGRIGGVNRDLFPGFAEHYRAVKKRCMELYKDIDTLLTKNRIFIDRVRNTGVISKEDAINFSYAGPMLRSTGFAHDLRKVEPYLVYDRFDFEVPVGDNGDNFDRYSVRMREILQSFRIIDQALEQIPDGPIISDDVRYVLPPKNEVYHSIEGMMNHFKLIMEGVKVPAGEIYSATEAANGELGFFIVSDGGGKPYRIHVRAPCFHFTASLPFLLEGGLLADIIPTFDAINMIGGELER
ncbi:MAG: NADH-quinone oxidoreductase subunit D [Myxococcota bacterium]